MDVVSPSIYSVFQSFSKADLSAGQFWLKYQDEPTHPLVNAAGAYREEYRKQHPNAPSHVEWTAGVIVETGLHVSNGTWSPRADWR